MSSPAHVRPSSFDAGCGSPLQRPHYPHTIRVENGSIRGENGSIRGENGHVPRVRKRRVSTVPGIGKRWKHAVFNNSTRHLETLNLNSTMEARNQMIPTIRKPPEGGGHTKGTLLFSNHNTARPCRKRENRPPPGLSRGGGAIVCVSFRAAGCRRHRTRRRGCPRPCSRIRRRRRGRSSSAPIPPPMRPARRRRRRCAPSR